jgi:DNA-binding IclR family transcriptional regulator
MHQALQEIDVAFSATLTATTLRDKDSAMTAVTSLERGLQILNLLIEVEADVVRRPRGVAIQQVANELGVHKSTASRLMRSLVAQGYAVPNPGSPRGFRLGPAVQIHQSLTMDERGLRELAHPFLEQIVEATGECAHAAVASGAWALVIDDVETDQPLRVVAGRGRRVPLHCTSAGKCLLAFGLASVPHELAARTSRTITNPEMLRLHLAEVVERGYALDAGHPAPRRGERPRRALHLGAGLQRARRGDRLHRDRRAVGARHRRSPRAAGGPRRGRRPAPVGEPPQPRARGRRRRLTAGDRSAPRRRARPRPAAPPPRRPAAAPDPAPSPAAPGRRAVERFLSASPDPSRCVTRTGMGPPSPGHHRSKAPRAAPDSLEQHPCVAWNA